MKKGIDISYYQGNVDFNKVKNSGIDFVILREGYRTKIDSKFIEYAQKAKNANLPVTGVYHFSYALTVDEAKEEARSCIANIEKAGLGKDIVVFFDFEYDTVNKAANAGVILGPDECNAHTVAFCEEVKSLGYTPGVYYNIDYRNNWYKLDVLDRYVKWLADWTGDADYECDYHQYSSKGAVPGIGCDVDMNYFYDKSEATGVTAEDVLNVARGWLGLSEDDGSFKEILDVYNSHKPLARGYAIKVTDEWCDAFVSAVAIKAKAVDLIGTEVGCEKHVAIFKKLGIWIEDGTVRPEPGDIILFNWNDATQANDGSADHIGYVEEIKDDKIVCIEGNKSRKVSRRTIDIGWGYIRGFARPKYAKSENKVEEDKKPETTPVTKPDNKYTLVEFVGDVQKVLGAKVDGIAGPETISKTPTLSSRKNRRHAVVKFVQKRLLELGYKEVGNIDGVAGPKFTKAVKHFQKDNACVVDGEITARNKTWKKLLGMI